jgi:hypothetical protein
MDPVYKFGETLSISKFKSQKGQQEFELTQREAMLLKYLVNEKENCYKKELPRMYGI